MLLSLPLVALGAALASPPAQESSGDVVASRVVSLPADQIYARLLDLHNIEAALDCTRKWQYGVKESDVGASATLVYKIDAFRRKLTMTLSKVDPDKKVTFDHAGNKGFVTTWTLSPEEDGTRVEVHSYLNMPPRPFQKMYARKIQPDWAACQDRAIGRLTKELGQR